MDSMGQPLLRLTQLIQTPFHRWRWNGVWMSAFVVARSATLPAPAPAIPAASEPRMPRR